ncbi:DUF2959 domain-containing protein [Pacificimonas sp. WHA3]|uniref:DUF2959 domain-containing protein n=1 Tax=Pacificimonas pallii TaxID=2827236 RepID=A0ABS6SHR3_9SPHN|nr:DUF2959 family protein [Pacificimonas pallii]MBV7257387.1 DUF2959 domain-containing protein [Pacificimonas pallii]
MIRPLACAAAVLTLAACETTPGYYTALEQLGIEKRDLLVDRVEDTRASQKGAQEAFRAALSNYRSTANTDVSRLEGAYDRFNGAYDNAKDKAAAVRSDIGSMRRVAKDLFAEWEAELNQYQDPSLRASSEAQLRDTKAKFAALDTRLTQSEAKMQPVLLVFRDRVLYLKHNLNAQAIAQMRGEEARISGDVDALIADLDVSIAEANRFIAEMRS